MSATYPLRPFLPADTERLQDLFAQSVEELTQDDYEPDERLAWMSRAADGAAFADRLGQATTLLVEVDGEILGFASLKADKEIDMLYVHPYYAGEGVGSALLTALETLAGARGAHHLTVDASETATPFFVAKGYQPVARNTVPVDGLWLTNTTMKKQLCGCCHETES